MLRALLAVFGSLMSALVTCSGAWAQEPSSNLNPMEPIRSEPSQGSTSSIGRGPADISQDLKREELARRAGRHPPALLQQWYDFKSQLEDKHNFEFILGYTAVHQRASENIIGGARGVALLRELYDYLVLTPPPATPTKEAAGGIAEFEGTWTLTGANTPNRGFIGFSVENRHRLGTEIPPQNLFLDAGAYWPTALAFSEFDLTVLQLYYEQYFADGAAGVRIGKTIPFVIYDYMSLKNPKTDFLNAAFNLNPAVGWASFGFGITGIVRPIEPLYILAGIHDINAGPTQGIESFFEDKEYFKAVEVGWDTELDVGKGNVHVLLWDTDRRTSTNTPSSRGFTVGGEQEFGRLLPFFRYGYSEGGGTPLRHLVAGGVGFKDPFGRPNDIIGVGLSWGEPIDNQLFVDQKVVEAYYRFHITDEVAFTPSFQYIKDPPLNLAKDELYLFSVRGRAAF